MAVDLTLGSTLLAEEQFDSLLALNADKPVVINGNGYTITFAKGALSAFSGELNLGVQFNAGTGYAAIRSATGSKFVLMLEFKHSGTLPGEAQISIYVGTAFAGQTMEYLYYNPENGKLQCEQTAVVDANGYLTVTQDHCSSYGVAKIKGDDVPKTGDGSMVLVWWVLGGCCALGLLILLVGRLIKKKRV